MVHLLVILVLNRPLVLTDPLLNLTELASDTRVRVITNLPTETIVLNTTVAFRPSDVTQVIFCSDRSLALMYWCRSSDTGSTVLAKQYRGEVLRFP